MVTEKCKKKGDFEHVIDGISEKQRSHAVSIPKGYLFLQSGPSTSQFL